MEKISPYFLALEDVPGLSDSFLIQRRNQPFPQGAQVSVVVVVSGGRCLKAKARVPCVLGLLGSHCLQSLGGQSEGIFMHIPPTHTSTSPHLYSRAHKQNFILILLTLIQHHKVHFSQILIFLPVRTPDLVSDNRVAALLNSSRHVSSFRSTTDPYPREPLLFDRNLHI